MKKLLELLKLAVNTPKVLWFFILGLVVGALFTITLPTEWVLVPVLFTSFIVALTTKKEDKIDILITASTMLGGIFIWLLSIL